MNSAEGPLTETVFYILLALHHPLHGYGIAQEVEKITQGRVKLGAGTLYGALKTLQKNGWIAPCGEIQGGRGKKEYFLTEKGERIFKEEVKRLQELLRNAERILKNEEI